jgi:hypothetical protein
MERNDDRHSLFFLLFSPSFLKWGLGAVRLRREPAIRERSAERSGSSTPSNSPFGKGGGQKKKKQKTKAVSFLLPFAVCGLAILLASCTSSRTTQQTQLRFPTPVQRDSVLHRVAAMRNLGFQSIAARLKLGIDTALAFRQLDTLLAKPTGDIFWMYPATSFYFNCREQLNDYWRGRFRSTWKRYTPYRGDTENHFLMYYAAIFLFSQEWPGLPGSEWFNGKSSQENYHEANEYLNHWVDETVRLGQTEWDSPRYFYYYMAPVIALRDFTRDPVMQRRFDMILEYLLADFAAEYLNGNYCGAHSRDGDGSVIDPRKGEATSYGQFYFEDSLSFILPDLAFAAMSRFQCPEIIRDIAHDRSEPFVHTERKRSRAKMRFSDERYTPVYKYDYMTPDYCLGSIQGGLQQPIQQHTWDVTFASEKPNNTIFALHPTYSGTELGMFFPEEPELMVDAVTKSKASYGNENKWIGGSPYERVYQYENTLIALYDVPKEDPVHHIDFFFPKTLDTLIRDSSGWIFCRMGRAFVGVYGFSADTSWTSESNAWRLRFRLTPAQVVDGDSIDLQRNGYLVTCAEEAEESFDRFIQQLRTSSMWEVVGYEQRFRFSNESGKALQTGAYQSSHSLFVDDMPQTPDSTSLFSGPHLRSVVNSGVLEMRCNGSVRILDFNRNEIR